MVDMLVQISEGEAFKDLHVLRIARVLKPSKFMKIFIHSFCLNGHAGCSNTHACKQQQSEFFSFR